MGSPEERGAPPGGPPPAGGPSWGNVSDRHWSRARRGKNREAIEYYRQRSRAPGVAGGGAERNFYCMGCDGVIPFGFEGERCPHCSAELEGKARRYFNWVEIDQPPASDLRALLPVMAGVVLLAALAALAAWWLLR